MFDQFTQLALSAAHIAGSVLLYRSTVVTANGLLSRDATMLKSLVHPFKEERGEIWVTDWNRDLNVIVILDALPFGFHYYGSEGFIKSLKIRPGFGWV